MNKTKIPLNQILYGPPGTGKTYNSKIRAISIILGLNDYELDQYLKDENNRNELRNKYNIYSDDDLQTKYQKLFDYFINKKNIMVISPHSHLNYSDLIGSEKQESSQRGINYEFRDGLLMNFINENQRDNRDYTNKFVLILEITAYLFLDDLLGELVDLLEEDKRIGAKNELNITLPNGKIFCLPPNFYLIGITNSIIFRPRYEKLLRRFSLEEMMPKPELLKNNNVAGINLGDLLDTINKRIEYLLDRDHLIGHSYFMGINDEEGLKNTFKDKIIPLLQVYFYGDYGKIGLVLGSGFVEINNVKIDANKLFADFKYEDSSELIKTIYRLLIDNTDFNIISAINNLLLTKAAAEKAVADRKKKEEKDNQ